MTSLTTAPVLLLAVLLALVGCAPGGDDVDTPEPTPTSAPETPPSGETPDQNWATCTNPQDGYTIDYPADWATNEEPIDHVAPCSLFDPDPAQLRTEGMELPTDIAVSVFLEAAPFEDVTRGAASGVDELSRSEQTVDGRAAVRRELEATGEGLYPQGLRLTVWAIDLDGTTLVAQTFDAGEPEYETAQQVLDDMVATVTVDEGSRVCSAAGSDASLAAQDGLPDPVAQTRADIARAAAACDYEALARLGGAGLTYSFGDEGDAAGFWRRQEAAGAEPLRHLVELLARPHATVAPPDGTQYVWPSAFAYDSWDAVPDDERDALRPLYDDTDFADFAQFGGYNGHRVGIGEDGDWLFFVAGD